ncbi:MAG: RlmE family RNA methyltransferase [Spirochaetaceae bacterium]|jgi:23S rRNA (uridine2552-2'-O)-methyltransferase|nr:RlmE family RNA methyltransferase [Spirochaetaceae bacterium]
MARHYKRPDYWTLKAHREGFPARSVYKLQEMDEKFALFGRGSLVRVLDLGAAPGSWSLYAARRWGQNLALTAVDTAQLLPACAAALSSSAGSFVFVQGDMTALPVREAVSSHGPFDIVMSDAAPATTGNSSVDSLRSLALAEAALDYAAAFLVKDGNFLVKVFQSADSAALLSRLRSLFLRAQSFKPKACRSESFETYYLGLQKRSNLSAHTPASLG